MMWRRVSQRERLARSAAAVFGHRLAAIGKRRREVWIFSALRSAWICSSRSRVDGVDQHEARMVSSSVIAPAEVEPDRGRKHTITLVAADLGTRSSQSAASHGANRNRSSAHCSSMR